MTMATNPSEFLSDAKMFREKSSAFQHENTLRKLNIFHMWKFFAKAQPFSGGKMKERYFAFVCCKNGLRKWRLFLTQKSFEQRMSFPTCGNVSTSENVSDKCYLSAMRKSFEEMTSFPDVKRRKDAFPRRADVLGTGFLCPLLKCLGQWLVFPFLIVT